MKIKMTTKMKMKTKRRKTRQYNHRKNNMTKKNYIQTLQTLYPKCKHDDTSEHCNYDGHKITYGEMEYDGIQQLYSIITDKYNTNIDCFMDIGSGRGKLCMFMAAQPKIKHVLGVELVEKRHQDAENLKSKLTSSYANKVELLNENIFNVNLREHSGENVFVWFSNLCFDQANIELIFKKFTEELPSGSIICCSKKPDSNTGLNFLETIKIPMSWSKESNVYMYKT